MNKMLKRTLCVVTLICLFCGMTVSAAWEFAGYDTTNPGQYAKLYNEVIAGNYTSKYKVEPVAPEDVEWKFEGFEMAYPHVGYERLYLEGNAQNAITRTTNLYPQWDVRFRDYMWEVCGDHQIWERQQTKINNKYWAWDFGNEALNVPDSAVFVPTNRYAEVVDEWKNCGIMNLDMNGNYVFDVTGKVYDEDLFTAYSRFAMPDAFEVKVDPITGEPTKNIVDGNFFSIENLSQINRDTGKHVVTDEMIAEELDIMATKFTTGPSFHGEPATKDVAKMYVDNIDAAWEWDDDVVIEKHDAVIDWTTPIYEMAEPYCYYQFLIVNGLVLDGRNDTPEVKRYTDGKAYPDVEWRYHAVKVGDKFLGRPYEIVEVKYIRDNDGKMVMAYENGEPVYRFPTGKYANAHYVVTDTEIQLWAKSEYADELIARVSRVDGPFLDLSNGYTNGAIEVE